LLDEQRTAATAEALMRSRYSAFHLRRADYLLASWHHTTRPASFAESDWQDLKWIGLKIISSQAGQPGDLTGNVEFIARFKTGGRAGKLHERSQFVCENGRWFYVDGEMLP